MGDNYKTMIVPFVALFALVLQLMFNINIDADVQTQITTALADMIGVGAVVYGIVKSHDKNPT